MENYIQFYTPTQQLLLLILLVVLNVFSFYYLKSSKKTSFKLIGLFLSIFSYFFAELLFYKTGWKTDFCFGINSLREVDPIGYRKLFIERGLIEHPYSLISNIWLLYYVWELSQKYLKKLGFVKVLLIFFAFNTLVALLSNFIPRYGFYPFMGVDYVPFAGITRSIQFYLSYIYYPACDFFSFGYALFIMLFYLPIVILYRVFTFLLGLLLLLF